MGLQQCFPAFPYFIPKRIYISNVKLSLVNKKELISQFNINQQIKLPIRTLQQPKRN